MDTVSALGAILIDRPFWLPKKENCNAAVYTTQYAHTAKNFTSRFPVQYKIQVRQLRAQHEDNYYCNTQFLYFKLRAMRRCTS